MLARSRLVFWQAMIHAAGRIRQLMPPYHSRWHADYRGVRRYVVQHHATGTNFGAGADFDIAQNLSAGAD